MAFLRGPDGCPWDREQTHDSLRQYLLEEVHEVFEALDNKDIPHFREELGDLLLQVVFHAQIASEDDLFTLSEVLADLVAKLKKRHPHIFGDARADTSDEVLERWERIKKQEKERTSLLDGVPLSLPALLLALKFQTKAAQVGMDWEGPDPVLARVRQELSELEAALEAGDGGELELGDVLFTIVNLGRHLGIEPEDALKKACRKFRDRFQYLEAEAAKRATDLKEISAAEKDVLWEEAKKKEADAL